MKWIHGSILNLALFALSVHGFIAPLCASGEEIPSARNMEVAVQAPVVDRKTAPEIPVADKKGAVEKVGAGNLRCPDNKPWSDEIVARSINVPLERLKALKSARSMTNDQVCTFPEPMLKRAWTKLETAKAGMPDEWAAFHNLRRRSDDGTVKADGLIRGHEHRKGVLKKIAEKKAGKRGGAMPPDLQPGTADPSGAGQTTIDIPSAGVDIGLAGIDSSQWNDIGPGNIGGRIRAIAIDPTNSNSIWVGGVAGGMYHSTDYGASFSPVNDFMANLAISSIVFDPSNPNTMYAGTGEGFFAGDGVRGYGVFKSIDRGATWNQLTSTTPSTTLSDYNFSWYYVNRLAISGNGATLLAATRGAYSNGYGGIFRSTDGGNNWSMTYPTARVFDVRFDPNDPNKAIAGAQFFDTGTSKYDNSIITSVNGGQSWTKQKSFVTTGSIRIEFAYAKTDSQIVYASVDQNSGEVWKSSDGGVTWNLMGTPQHLGNQGRYDNTIWVDPTDPNHVVAAGLDVYRSTGGGTAWTKISNWGNNQMDVRYNGGTSHTPHADHHALVSDPNYNGTTNRVLYDGNDGGLYRAADITLAGQTSGWDELNNGIALTQFYSVAGHSTGGSRIIGGTQDNGMLMNAGPGSNWSMFNGGDGGFAAVDATNDNYLYGEYVYLQICRSTNRGSGGSCSYIDKIGTSQLSDSRSGSTANFIAPFILDPNDNNRMLAGGLSLWVNNAVRSGTSWTAIKSPTGTSSKLSAIAVAEGNSAIIWVGHNDGSVYRTANGTDFTPIWTLVSGGIAQARIVNRIVIDRDDPTKVYVAFGGYNNNNLWCTTNNGATWSDLNSPGRVLPSVPFFGLARHPLRATWLYVGTEVGLFTSQDGGTTWSTSNDGPANVEIADLAWRDYTTLIAATHGRGMFLATASVPVTGTTTGVGSNRNPAYYGQSVTFTATVSSTNATGMVTFYDGATTLGSANVSYGTATYSTAALSAGSHSITASYGGDNSFSASTSSAVIQTVIPAILNISVNAGQSKIYGASDPVLTYASSGFVNGDTVSIMTGSLTRAVGENVGNHAISQGTLSAGSNYTITFTGADLTIYPATLAVSAASKSKVYGNGDPPLTYTVAGFVNGDTASIMAGSLTRITGEAVGNYAILQGTVACGSNYVISYTGANLTIIPAVVRLVAEGQSDVFSATLADAVSDVPADRFASLRLLNGDINESLKFAVDAEVGIAGGYDADLSLQLEGTVSRLRGPMTVSKGKLSVSRVKIY